MLTETNGLETIMKTVYNNYANPDLEASRRTYVC